MLWMFTLHPAWRVRPWVMALFFTVFVVIMAVLVIREGEVALDVRDDGRGFDGSAGSAGGFGLAAMRQRIEGLSGTLQVESEPGGGTAISACVPAGSAVAPGAGAPSGPACAPSGPPPRARRRSRRRWRPG